MKNCISIYEAAEKGDLPAVKRHIKMGANVNARDKDGRTALRWAAARGHLNVVKLLVEKGANVDGKNRRGSTPLMRAAGNGKMGVVRFLVATGADVNARDKEGRTACVYASKHHLKAMVKYLVSKGADMRAKAFRMPLMMNSPRNIKAPMHVKRFRDILLDNPIDCLDSDYGKMHISGHRGIQTISRIQYNWSPINLLGRDLEYTFHISPEHKVEISLQLYENIMNHWRLFAFCKKGLLISVNLTLLREHGQQFTVSQTLSLAVHNMTSKERTSRTADLCRILKNIGMEVDDNHRLILGTFNTATGNFIDTSSKVFLRSFLTAALIKGHFMGNKGYALHGLPKQSQFGPSEKRVFKGRSIPLGLRYQVLLRANSKCVRCGRGVKDGLKLHVDHRIPVSQGGLTELANLRVLCSDCNSGKGDRFSR